MADGQVFSMGADERSNGFDGDRPEGLGRRVADGQRGPGPEGGWGL